MQTWIDKRYACDDGRRFNHAFTHADENEASTTMDVRVLVHRARAGQLIIPNVLYYTGKYQARGSQGVA